MLTLVLVRHGATAWNENAYCQGRKDVPLSALGKKQVTLLKEAQSGLVFDRAYASPLGRALETARLLGYEPDVLDDLAEIDRGHWEGHPMDEVKRRWGKLYRSWYEDPAGLVLPGGEAFDDFWVRAQRALDAVCTAADGRVLVCAHKAINRAIIARALGMKTAEVWPIPQPQASRSVLVLEAGSWRAEALGSADHLPEDLRSEN